tara:strand:- start:3280 stop:3636 length:357 start_codon:yes stop_codon:yes gene_type:complete
MANGFTFGMGSPSDGSLTAKSTPIEVRYLDGSRMAGCMIEKTALASFALMRQEDRFDLREPQDQHGARVVPDQRGELDKRLQQGQREASAGRAPKATNTLDKDSKAPTFDCEVFILSH